MYIKNIDFSGTVRVYLDSSANKSHQTEIDISNSESWRKFEAELESSATEDGGLSIEFNGTGTLCVDFVQLIPQKLLRLRQQRVEIHNPARRFGGSA
ncbi:MAG: hypothetical protein L6V88_11510 [Anaerotruncus sp.]|nr:MAG: hypothetical protein L6V88_11510 [Anaerotruncus sp.]